MNFKSKESLIFSQSSHLIQNHISLLINKKNNETDIAHIIQIRNSLSNKRKISNMTLNINDNDNDINNYIKIKPEAKANSKEITKKNSISNINTLIESIKLKEIDKEGIENLKDLKQKIKKINSLKSIKANKTSLKEGKKMKINKKKLKTQKKKIEEKINIKSFIKNKEKKTSYIDELLKYFQKSKNTVIKRELIGNNSPMSNKNYFYSYYKLDNCNPITCPNYVGFCGDIEKNKNKCMCNTNTLNYLPKDPLNLNIYKKTEDYLCNYEEKSKIVAILLEVMFPFGLGHFYSERFLFGILKFLIFFIMPLLLLLIFGFDVIDKVRDNLVEFNLNKDLNQSNSNITIEQQFEDKVKYFKNFNNYFILIQIWFFLSLIFDLLLFGFGIYKDGNGFDLV
jgi:hypothetical protein